MLRVKGVILSPTNDTVPYTSLLFETITGSTEVLPSTTALIELGEDGAYDFNLLLGAYRVYAKYADSMRMDILGTCAVSIGMKPEMTLNELVSNYTYYPLAPDWALGLDKKWQSLFDSLINDINTNVTNLNMAIVDGDARVIFDMTTYTNDVTGQLGATLIQQIKAGDSEILNQSIAYSDVLGNQLATNILGVSNSVSSVQQELTAWKTESGNAFAGILQRIELNEANLGSAISAEVNAQTGMMELRINEYIQFENTELRSYMDATINQVTGELELSIGDKIATGDTLVKNEMKVYVDEQNATQTAAITQQINTLNGAIQQQISVIEGDLDALNGTMGSTIQTMTNINNSLGVTNQTVANINNNLGVTNQNLANTNTEVGNLAAGLNNTNQNLANTNNSLATTQAAWQVVATIGELTSAIGMINNGYNSTIYMQANNLVLTDSNQNITVQTAPFVMTGGQIFIKSAMIADGSITNAKIGNTIASTNYVPQSTGWQLDKSGTFEINGNTAGEGRMVQSNTQIKVYDGSNNLRVILGKLTQ